jgi:hypothetical protein
MLINEEVLTCVQIILGSVDACLRQLKECATIVVDGMPIFYCNNWLQLSPTFGPTLFTQPSPNAYVQNRAGYNFYQKINHSFYLAEIM